MGARRNGRWSIAFESCIRCGQTSHKHVSRGLCNRCYMAEYNAAHIDAQRALKRAWYLKNVAGTGKGKVAREQRNFGGKRRDVLDRDGNRCASCGSPEKLVVHHADSNGRGSRQPNNDLDNLVTLCRACHLDEHRPAFIAARMARTHCKRGHPKSQYGRFNGRQWICKKCAAECAARRKLAKRR